VRFPGLKVVTTVCSGVKLTTKQTRREDKDNSSNNNNINEWPEYEFIMIGERRSVQGPKPLVWIYNQLTGGGGNKKNSDNQKAKGNGDTDDMRDASFNPSSTSARSLVSVVKQGDDDDGDAAYAFTFDLEMQIRLEFPKALVRILPTSKERMEEQGSAAVLSSVKGDVVAAIAAAREAFVRDYCPEATTTATTEIAPP